MIAENILKSNNFCIVLYKNSGAIKLPFHYKKTKNKVVKDFMKNKIKAEIKIYCDRTGESVNKITFLVRVFRIAHKLHYANLINGRLKLW